MRSAFFPIKSEEIVTLETKPAFSNKVKKESDFFDIQEFFIRKKSHGSRWYKKRFYKGEERIHLLPYGEVYTQELFRLLIPHQPKARLFHEETSGKIKSISKKVEGFKSFYGPVISENSFDFGRMLVCILWTNESDAHPDNLGANYANKLTKIDGDMGFAELLNMPLFIPGSEEYSKYDEKNKANHTITSAVIAALPLQDASYAANNWPTLAVSQLDEEKFREGVNSTILKIAMLPDSFLQDFFNSYTDQFDVSVIFYNEIIKRKAMIENAILSNQKFRDFICSGKAKAVVQPFIDEIKEFKTTGKSKPFKDEHRIEMVEKFKKIENLFSHRPLLSGHKQLSTSQVRRVLPAISKKTEHASESKDESSRFFSAKSLLSGEVEDFRYVSCSLKNN